MKSNFSKSLLFASLVSVSLVLSGCSPTGDQTGPRNQQGSMDTPGYHNQSGDRYLASGQYDQARDAFSKAVQLDPTNSHALSGLFVAKAHQTNRPEVSTESKAKIAKEGEELIDQALDAAKTDAEKARVHHFATRFYVVLGHGPSWYKYAKEHFESAQALNPKQADAYFYFAQAEAQSLNYEAAAALYKKVLEIGGPLDEEADRELKRIHKIQRALPSSNFGKEVGNLPVISRADLAALLLVELRLDQYYTLEQRQSSPSFAPPETRIAFSKSPAQNMPDATDILSHPLQDSIELVLKFGVKGLEADSSHKFHPSEGVTRAELALIMQDILVRTTGQTALETKYVGEASPHPDVPKDRWYYNAVRVTVTRGLMEVDAATGNFNPMGKVSGADALIAVRNLKALRKK